MAAAMNEDRPTDRPLDDDPAFQTPMMQQYREAKQECPDAPWELMLCGHTHGGQVHIPFYGPARVAVLDERYAVGLNPFAGGRWIHTTRGVGNILGFRVNCRPELSTLVLT